MITNTASTPNGADPSAPIAQYAAVAGATMESLGSFN